MTDGGEWTGRTGGMGSRRQDEGTDPAQRDDSHELREEALADADRDEFREEGYTANPRTAERTEPEPVSGPVGFSEDELDNQSPHRNRAEEVQDQ